MARELTAHERAVVGHLRALVGGEVRVAQYRDEQERPTVAVCLAKDWPDQGITTYATAGLSAVEVRPGLGAELIGPGAVEQYGDVLATAATFVLREGWKPRPDVVFEEVARIGWPDTTLPHLLLVDPGLYQRRGLETLHTADRAVAFLQPLPISDAELEVVRDQGASALHELLEQADADVYDPRRPSVA